MKQLQTTDQIKYLVQIRKSLERGKAGNLAENAAFADFLTIQSQLVSEIEAVWGVVFEKMDEYDITQIKGSWGSLSMAERKNWKADKPLPARFYKQVLDTTKLSLLDKAGEKLPKGAFYTTTKFLQKRIKVEV